MNATDQVKIDACDLPWKLIEDLMELGGHWLPDLSWDLYSYFEILERSATFASLRKLENLSVDGQTICLTRCYYSALINYLLRKRVGLHLINDPDRLVSILMQ